MSSRVVHLLGSVLVILGITTFSMISSRNLVHPPDIMIIAQAANATEMLQRFTNDIFKTLNKRLESVHSHLGSLRDTYSMLKMQQSTALDTAIAHVQRKCDFGTQVRGNWEVSNNGTWEWTKG